MLFLKNIQKKLQQQTEVNLKLVGFIYLLTFKHDVRGLLGLSWNDSLV